MDDKLKSFIHKHRINILDTSKRAHDMSGRHIRYTMMDDMSAYSNFQIPTIPLYTIEITEKELQHLADFEDQVRISMEKIGSYNIFETLMAIKEEEQYLRDTYPAVKKAYDHYTLMLKLVQAGEMNA